MSLRDIPVVTVGPGSQPREDDGSQLEARRPPVLVSVPEPPASSAPADGPLAVLCLNCELRAECALPKAPGGVWFCEEYR